MSKQLTLTEIFELSTTRLLEQKNIAYSASAGFCLYFQRSEDGDSACAVGILIPQSERHNFATLLGGVEIVVRQSRLASDGSTVSAHVSASFFEMLLANEGIDLQDGGVVRLLLWLQSAHDQSLPKNRWDAWAQDLLVVSKAFKLTLNTALEAHLQLQAKTAERLPWTP